MQDKSYVNIYSNNYNSAAIDGIQLSSKGSIHIEQKKEERGYNIKYYDR